MPAKILIVEDERVVARDIEYRLTRLGYQIAGSTRHGEEAVRLAAEARPDLVLMDIRLEGEIDGIAAAEEIRKRLLLPIVYLTAYADEDTLQRARITEPFGYILKPFDERELRTAIEMALYKHEVERSQMRLEEQFRQAQKMEAVGRLAGGVAHDFNNLLTAIICLSEMLLVKNHPEERARELITEIHKAGERGARLTRQLLAFSRKQVLQPTVLNLNEVVAAMHKMLATLIGEDIDLRVALDPTLGLVKADVGQLEQVIINLAVNARDAMPQGGSIEIRTANDVLDETYVQEHPDVQPGPYIRMSVSDTGHGIDKVTLDRLFEPFFTTKEVGKGTGLGLATVYGSVKQSGGHVAVRSEVGKGTTFDVFLPCLPPEIAEGDPARQPSVSAGGTETILLVEDDPSVRSLTRSMLMEVGYSVLEAGEGDSAITLSRSHKGTIHLLMTDVVMPGMNGRDLANHIAKERPGLKVLYISGYTNDAVIARGVVGGETHFLQKPFRFHELTSKVRAVLDGIAKA
jgi:signal transduction histidine kinase